MHQFLVLCGCVWSVYAFNFDEKSVKVIYNIQNNSYFGYSILLQKGQQPAVIVGAPRKNPDFPGGILYYCTLDGTCSNYVVPEDSHRNINKFNGDMLGLAVDGDENTGKPLIFCAPRFITASWDNYFMYGYCFEKRNSSSYNNINDVTIIDPLKNKAPVFSSIYYDYGFAEAGLDVHYLQEEQKILLGAPGVKNWNGIFVVQPLFKFNTEYDIIPKRPGPKLNENFSYLGYKVTSARLEYSRRNVWYIAGAPRGNRLLGNVQIFDKNEKLVTKIIGFEIGSYFGSSILAVDLNNDRIDDLLIGAPTGKGNSWDEGYVYVYESLGQVKFDIPTKLSGSRKPGARFGTCIAPLGDIDLDTYNDVAISAPYEDDGVGAVYIYRGSDNGINLQYSQRLSPTKFSPSPNNVKGFGQGLSRGVDIDGNGYSDLAIGAYMSDQVFIIKAKSIIDFQISLESNEFPITSDVINVKYCVSYTQRSKLSNLKTVIFVMELDLDSRAKSPTHIKENVDVVLSNNYCRAIDVELKPSPLDSLLFPFKLSLKSEIQRSDVIAIGDNQIQTLIPYSHGCGDDDICQTQISVEAYTSLSHIVLGSNKEIVVDVVAKNGGEPGYDCKINLNFPNIIELRDIKDCVSENNSYTCYFTEILKDRKEVQFLFDIKLKNPKVDNITMSFEVNCLGENVPSELNKHEISLNVLLQNRPYIQGSSVPNNVYFTDEIMHDVEVSHIFNIGNWGPSPVKLEVYFLLPILKTNETDIFDLEATGSLNGIESQCFYRNTSVKTEESYGLESLPTEQFNSTIIINCFEEGIECLELFCDGEYIFKTTEIAHYTVKIKIRTNLLVSKYIKELETKNTLAYISTAYIINSEGNRTQAYAATQIFINKKINVPLWIYIVASVIGILLLGLLVFLFYKCHFFDRNYRDKLNDEKLMDQKIEEDSNGDTLVEESLSTE